MCLLYNDCVQSCKYFVEEVPILCIVDFEQKIKVWIYNARLTPNWKYLKGLQNFEVFVFCCFFFFFFFLQILMFVSCQFNEHHCTGQHSSTTNMILMSIITTLFSKWYIGTFSKHIRHGQKTKHWKDACSIMAISVK